MLAHMNLLSYPRFQNECMRESMHVFLYYPIIP